MQCGVCITKVQIQPIFERLIAPGNMITSARTSLDCLVKVSKIIFIENNPNVLIYNFGILYFLICYFYQFSGSTAFPMYVNARSFNDIYRTTDFLLD